MSGMYNIRRQNRNATTAPSTCRIVSDNYC